MISNTFNRQLAASVIGRRMQIETNNALCSDGCSTGCTEAGRCHQARIGEANKASS